MEKTEITRISLNKIKLSRNSRVDIREEELDGLMQSIKQTGLLQPIGLVKRDNGSFEVAFGNRRFLACSKLGWSKIPAIVREEKDQFGIDIQNLTENIQRRNLTFTEVGRFIELLQKEGLSYKECAVRLGVTPKYVQSAVETFQRVPKEFRDLIEIRTGQEDKGAETAPGKISLRQATAIINISKKMPLLGRQVEGALFKAARKHGSKFRPEQVASYALNVQHGKDPFDGTIDVKHITIGSWVTEKEWERLEKKYVLDGPFRSISALIRAVLRGEVSERIKLFEGPPKDKK